MDYGKDTTNWLEGFFKAANDAGITEPEDIQLLLKMAARLRLSKTAQLGAPRRMPGEPTALQNVLGTIVGPNVQVGRSTPAGYGIGDFLNATLGRAFSRSDPEGIAEQEKAIRAAAERYRTSTRAGQWLQKLWQPGRVRQYERLIPMTQNVNTMKEQRAKVQAQKYDQQLAQQRKKWQEQQQAYRDRYDEWLSRGGGGQSYTNPYDTFARSMTGTPPPQFGTSKVKLPPMWTPQQG
jgi:hypothetical protein